MKIISKTGLLLIILVFSVISLNGQEPEIEITFFQPEEFINNYKLEIFALLLDARPASMYKKSRIEGAINAGSKEVLKVMSDTLDANSPLYIYCSTQSRSTSAAEFLVDEGFTKLYVMVGGMMEWKSLDLPLDRKRLGKKT